MSGHTATTLAYVRTSAGVVRVDAGAPLPDDVEETELDRLVRAGAVETAAPQPTPEDEVSASNVKGSPRGKTGKDS